MGRRADPVRTYQASKAATIERLVGEGIPRVMVERWIESYEGGDADLHRAWADPAAFFENAYHYARDAYDRGEKPPPAPHLERRAGSRPVRRARTEGGRGSTAGASGPATRARRPLPRLRCSRCAAPAGLPCEPNS